MNESGINGSVALDEEAYQLWLRDDAAACGHLIKFRYNGSSAVYPNWVNYIAKVSDFPKAGYREVIKSIPSFTRKIGDDLTGAVAASIGNLVLTNIDGTLDDWLKLAWDGQLMQVFQGDPAWAEERFRILFECIVEAVTEATRETITLRLRGVEHGENKPIQTNLIPDNTTTAPGSNRPVPLAHGDVFNISPVLLDDANQIYQWHDGIVASVSDVRDSGVPFRASQIIISGANTVTDVMSTTVYGVHGFFPNTRVRCDVGTFPVVGSWRCCAWNGTLFAALGYNSAIGAVSRDGILWTQVTLPVSGQWACIKWNGTIFCALDDSMAKGIISPDGTNWTQITPVQFADAIDWNGTTFCAVSNGTDLVQLSPDGISWTSGHYLPAAGSWSDIKWNGKLFCAICYGTNMSATSLDGITWVAGTLPSVAAWQMLSWNGTVFLAVAASSSAVAAISPDGLNWTASTMPSANLWQRAAWNGSLFAVTVWGDNKVATSPDGVTWTLRTIPSVANWVAICWNGYILVMLGDASTAVSISADGVSWSATTNILPTPLAINTDYWVISDGYSTTDFKLSATRGGPPIHITVGNLGAPLVGFHWTADLPTGKIYLDSRPAGQLTMDGVSGTWRLPDTRPIAVSAILPGVLLALNVDQASQAAFVTKCDRPYGIYISERRNRLDVAADLVSGLGAWYGYSRASFLRMGRIEASYTAHDLEILEDDMSDGSFVLERMIPPAKLHRASFRKNWTDQTGKLAAYVSTEQRGFFSTPYSITAPVLGADEGTDGSEFHALALKPDVFETLLVLGADARAEALRRDAMFYNWGAIFKFEIGRLGAEIDIGTVLKVTHPRYGFAGGVRVPVVHVEDKPTERHHVIKFFSALPAYTPGQL